MSTLARAALAAALFAGFVPLPASAQPNHRHKARHYAHRVAPRYAEAPYNGYARGYGYYAPLYGHGSTGPYGPNSADPYPPTEADNPYNPYAPAGAALRALARRNQNAPGVTNELAPDNIATATGGPSGGIPGLSGH